MTWVQDDGGRAAAGYRGEAGDCVARAVAIATGLPYQEVYDAINIAGNGERVTWKRRRRSGARTGVYKPTIRRYMIALGWTVGAHDAHRLGLHGASARRRATRRAPRGLTLEACHRGGQRRDPRHLRPVARWDPVRVWLLHEGGLGSCGA
jgi:hypothetical protein